MTAETNRTDPTTTEDWPGLIDAAEQPRATGSDLFVISDQYRTVGSLARLIARAGDGAGHLAAPRPAHQTAIDLYHDDGADPVAAVAAISDQLAAADAVVVSVVALADDSQPAVPAQLEQDQP